MEPTKKIGDALPGIPFYVVCNGLLYPCEWCAPNPDSPETHHCKLVNVSAFIDVPSETECFEIATITPKTKWN